LKKYYIFAALLNQDFITLKTYTMASNKVELNWTDKMAFDVEANGHHFIIDAEPHVGGLDRGPRPKILTLASLGGCTAMDVISILGKMRVEVEDFNVSVEGDLTEEHPKYYHTIRIIYTFKGKDLPMEKLEKAVNLSQDRYCGVTAMLSKSSKIEHKIVVIE
jgi:putative redox protein